ncbi:MAG: outer membrane beta-barrel protein [Alloprevotella sp.]|nr:outer membrane beta-barrel protein [Alloprevotella sp.]
MKRIILASALMLCGASGYAGGILTNTNHSASFLRMPAQEAYISIEGAYYNPAGIGFLKKGFHFAFNNQSAFQTRTVETTFGAFAYGMDNNGQMTKKYKGKATAPIIPALDFAYVGDKWFGSFHFGVIGGGGKCTFDNGLGSFESVVSVMPTALNALTNAMGMGDLVTNRYGMNTYMRGKQFYFGAQVGVGYKITPELSVSVGVRLVRASSNYYGYVKDIQLFTAQPLPVNGQVIPAGTQVEAGQLLDASAAMLANMGMSQQALTLEKMRDMVSQVEVNADQQAWGVAPVIGLHWHHGKWNVGARYEFKTRLHPKNSSTTTVQQAQLLNNVAEFVDGQVVEGDMPGFLGVGVGYEFTPRLRVNASMHYYFDKQAHQYENKQKKLKSNTWEVLAGVEYDITDKLTASLGGQLTNYGFGKGGEYLSDLSFSSSSYSLGLGVKYKVSEHVGINLSYFKTFYYSKNKVHSEYYGLGQTMKNIAGFAAQEQLIAPDRYQAIVADVDNRVMQGQLAGKERFDRTNDVIGIGIDLHF